MDEKYPDGESPLEETIPGLAGTDYEITSEYNERYNCLAWAFNDDSKKWSPDPRDAYYWPDDIGYDGSLESLIKYIEREGFEFCGNNE